MGRGAPSKRTRILGCPFLARSLREKWGFSTERSKGPSEARLVSRSGPQNDAAPTCRRSKLRVMHARPLKDAAHWHESGVKNIANHSSTSPIVEKERCLSAIPCMCRNPCSRPPRNLLILRGKLRPLDECNGSGIAPSYAEPCAFVCPRAAPGLFRNPDGLTDSVSTAILLLQTDAGSIH